MFRRSFIRSSAWGVLGIRFLLNQISPSDHRKFIISHVGCGRATGYAEANKIVSWNGKTHFSWLDSDKGRFIVRIRTYDHTSMQLSPTFDVGEAHDNHGGPALTIDSEGYLHVVYFPHHHPMRYRKSLRTNDASAWSDVEYFGERTTYPTLVCGKDGTLFCSLRRSFREDLWQLELWKKPPGKTWQGPQVLVKSQYLGYTHFQESLAWGPNHHTLHLACRVHEKTDESGYGKIQTVAYMRSPDFGTTWLRADGSEVMVPAASSELDVLADGGAEVGINLRIGGLAIDDRGSPSILYSWHDGEMGKSFLSRWSGKNWKRIDLHRFLPRPYQEWFMLMPGGLTYLPDGRLKIVAQIQRSGKSRSTWGEPSTEIVQLLSDNACRTFDVSMLTAEDANVPHWLPSLERPTGFNKVGKVPAVMYTAGGAGSNNSDILQNKVFGIF